MCPVKPSHIISHTPKQPRIMTCSSIHSPWNIIIHLADAWEVPSSVTEEITESLGVPSMAALPPAWFLLCAQSHQCKGICMSPSHSEGLLGCTWKPSLGYCHLLTRFPVWVFGAQLLNEAPVSVSSVKQQNFLSLTKSSLPCSVCSVLSALCVALASCFSGYWIIVDFTWSRLLSCSPTQLENK